MSRTLKRCITIWLLCSSWSAGYIAQAQTPPASLPARDTHDGLTISADPYLSADRYKDRFGKKNPYDAGIMAIDIYLRNENDKPIRVGLDTIRLVLRPEGHDRQRIEPMKVEDVADQILVPGGPNPTVSRKPLPGHKPKAGRGKDWQELVSVLRGVGLDSDLVPPHGYIHGFLYFDMDYHFEWISSGDLYFPDLKFFPEQKALLYFEVSLASVRVPAAK